MDAQELTRRLREARAGDRIELPPGRVQGQFVLDCPVTLVGAGASETILDGARAGGVLTVCGPEIGARFEDLTITGGRAKAGAGLAVNGGSQVSLHRCRFEDNRAELGRGGAIKVEHGRVELDACELVFNRALEGGALYLGAGARARLHECWIAQNAAERGGAVGIADDAQLRLDGCRFEENEAVRKAHHIYALGSSASRPHIELVHVAFGSVSVDGPSIVNDSDFKAEFELEHTVWPEDSERPSVRRAHRKFTLH